MKPPSGGPINGPSSAGTTSQASAETSSCLGTSRTITSRPDRRHHRAADPLNDAVDDEIEERGGGAAERRARREDDDRDAEHRARAEAVGHPAGNRNEDGKRQQIGGERELERDRILAQIDRDRRQRRGDHRRIEVLHEEGAGDDQGNDDLGGHAGRDSGLF